MDKVLLVEPLIEEGRELVAALERAGIAIDLAYWFYLEELGIWDLFLIPKRWSDAQGIEFLTTLHRVIREMPAGFSIEPFDVRVPRPREETVLALRRYAKKLSISKPVRLRKHGVENVYIEDAYIYPPNGIAAPM